MPGLNDHVSKTRNQPLVDSRGVVGLLLTVIPLSQIPLDAYTPAMPDMVRDLASSNALVQNTVTVYVLGMCLALIPLGMLGGLLGSQRHVAGRAAALDRGESRLCGSNRDLDVAGFPFLAGCRRGYLHGRSLCGGSRSLSRCTTHIRFRIAGNCVGIGSGSRTGRRGIFGAICFLAIRFCWHCDDGRLNCALAFLRLRETLPAERRVPFRPAGAGKVLFGALGNVRFVAYTAVFGLIASAQLVFGVVAPFLYQQNLGLSAGAYGLIALIIGGANLTGEMACTSLATRTGSRQLCFGALCVYFAGAFILLVSGLLFGASFLPITIGGMLALAGCGTLCPTMYGMALGLFSNNLGLLGGFISSLCYLAVSVTMALAAYLPETSQAPLGWVYVAIGAMAAVLLGISLPSDRSPTSQS